MTAHRGLSSLPRRLVLAADAEPLAPVLCRRSGSVGPATFASRPMFKRFEDGAYPSHSMFSASPEAAASDRNASWAARAGC